MKAQLLVANGWADNDYTIDNNHLHCDTIDFCVCKLCRMVVAVLVADAKHLVREKLGRPVLVGPVMIEIVQSPVKLCIECKQGIPPRCDFG
jgi:hypothetical protein